MFSFSNIVDIQGQFESATENNVSDGKEMTENIYYRSETEFASVKDSLNGQMVASNETRQQ